MDDLAVFFEVREGNIDYVSCYILSSSFGSMISKLIALYINMGGNPVKIYVRFVRIVQVKHVVFVFDI